LRIYEVKVINWSTTLATFFLISSVTAIGVATADDSSWTSLVGSWATNVATDETAQSVFGSAVVKTIYGLTNVANFGRDLVTHGLSRLSDADLKSTFSDQELASQNQSIDQTIRNDVTNLGLPSYLTNVVPMANKLLNDVDQRVSAVEASITAAGNKWDAAIDQLRPYFSPSENYGLEPGGSDTQIAKASFDSDPHPFIADANAIQQQSGATGAPDDEQASQQPAPDLTSHQATAPANDLVADLQGLGGDSGTASKDLSAINSDDLDALGGGSPPSGTLNSTIDTSQLQADLSDWDKQQAAAQLAREQEKARQNALARQQEEEESAQRAEAARLAQEQAEQDAANNADAQPKSGGGFWNGLAQTASLTQQILSLKHGGGAGIGGTGGDCTPPAATNAVQQCANVAGSSCGLLKSFASCLARAQAACGSCGSCIAAIRSQQMSAQSSAQVCN
jgi:hypothetical protein